VFFHRLSQFDQGVLLGKGAGSSVLCHRGHSIAADHSRCLIIHQPSFGGGAGGIAGPGWRGKLVVFEDEVNAVRRNPSVGVIKKAIFFLLSFSSIVETVFTTTTTLPSKEERTLSRNYFATLSVTEDGERNNSVGDRIIHRVGTNFANATSQEQVRPYVEFSAVFTLS